VPTGYPVFQCKRCGAPGRRKQELSRSGLCRDCGPIVAKEAQEQISAHRGPYFQKWRQGQAMSAGGLLPEQIAAMLDENLSSV
jgi:hypothetical protein